MKSVLNQKLLMKEKFTELKEKNLHITKNCGKNQVIFKFFLDTIFLLPFFIEKVLVKLYFLFNRNIDNFS